MATQLWKDGRSQWFQAHQVSTALEAGWNTEDKPSEIAADTNKSGKLSYKEIRDAAKEAGIEDWRDARIKDLKKRLGYEI